MLGDLTIEEGVTEAALQEKVAGLTVFGDVIAPAGLIGVVQVLATDVFGDIRRASGRVGATDPMDREAEFGRLYEAHRAAVHAYFVGRTGDRQLRPT